MCLNSDELIAEPGAHRRHVCSLNHQLRRFLHRGSSISIPTRLHRRSSTPVPNFRSRRPWHSQFDELAFWLLDCNSFTTCLIWFGTRGSEVQILSPRPYNQRLTDYLQGHCILCQHCVNNSLERHLVAPALREEAATL